MSEDLMLKCLIAFILGWLVSRTMGNGFSVSADTMFEEDMKEVQEGVNIVKKGMKFIDESGLTTCLDYHGESYWDKNNTKNNGLSLKNKTNECCNLARERQPSSHNGETVYREPTKCHDIKFCGDIDIHRAPSYQEVNYGPWKAGVCSKPNI